jgi:hypothetical protein
MGSKRWGAPRSIIQSYWTCPASQYHYGAANCAFGLQMDRDGAAVLPAAWTACHLLGTWAASAYVVGTRN